MRNVIPFRTAVACAATILISVAADATAAEQPDAPTLPQQWAAFANEPAAFAPRPPKADTSAAIEANKSYLIPALDIIGFDILVNLVNRPFSNDYHSNFSTIRHNLHRSWVVDSDPFKTNQLGHPYQGSMYHAFARSAGLNYWESLGYTFVGSAA